MRTWSIRTRTAVVFALASMALTAGVLAFVNVSALWSVSGDRKVTSVVQEADPDDVDGGPPEVAVTPGAPGGSGASDSSGGEGTVGAAATVEGVTVSLVAQAQWQWSAIGILGAGGVAGLVGWWVSRRMLRPIDRISERTNRISASTLHERIGLEGPDDELRRLSRTIDQLLDRLESAFASQRRFVAQASHELRTPLAVQRAALRIGLLGGDPELDAVRDELLDQNRRTERLVDSLLVLAEAERGIDGRVDPVDLGAVADEVVATCAPVAAGLGVMLAVDRSDEPLVVTAEPMLARQLLLNLVDNAVEYNVDGGHVRVVLSAAGCTVENSGPVVPDTVAAGLTEPFRRCPDAGGRAGRQHSGLGLSIVAAIASAHGWSLHVAARPEGGLRVRLGFGTVRAGDAAVGECVSSV